MVYLHVCNKAGFVFSCPLSPRQFQEFEQSPVLESAMAMDLEQMATTDVDLPQSINAGYLSPNAFGFLGVPPLVGRVFGPDDSRPAFDPQRVVVLGYGYWQTHFAGQPDIVGRALSLDHRSYAIICVMPRRFSV